MISKRRIVTVIIFWLCLINVLVGQSLQEDTIYLQEYEVVGIGVEDYAVGNKVMRVSSDSLLSRNLTELLQQQFPIYFRQYGAEGQLSSINLRGLGPARTSLNWNGMGINSFTLGQTDYNNISGDLFNQLNVHLGSGSSLFGNGAIGGTVAIRSVPKYDQKLKFGFEQTVGSFGKRRSQFQVFHGTQKFSQSTSIFFNDIQNNFNYDLDGEQLEQTGASYSSFGASTDLFHHLSSDGQLAMNFWYNFNDRDIQQAKGDFSEPDHLRDHAFRSSVKWLSSRGNQLSEYQVGYTYDHQVYNDGQPLTVNRFYGKVEQERNLGQHVVKFGANHNQILAESANYESNISESRNDLFVSLSSEINKYWRLSLNLREPVVEWEFKPFSPSLGNEIVIPISNFINLNLNNVISRSYRVPTINDRYWSPGGNPNLNAELSKSIESGVGVSVTKTGLESSIDFRHFYHEVDDWIIWRPGPGYWFPDNLRNVIAQGFELFHKTKVSVPRINGSISLNANASRTISENQEPLSQVDRSVGKQLPYTPIWVSNGSLQLDLKNFSWFAGMNYIGERFTEANNELEPLPAYQLVNAGLSYYQNIGGIGMVVSGSVQNIMDTDYENFENRAMPGRNYQLKLKIIYN